LAKQKFETERVSGKLESYLHSAYIIDRVYPDTGKDFGVVKSLKKGSTKTFSKIPDPDICHNLTKFPDNFSLTDLPDDLDFDYSKYSQWMANKGIKFNDELKVESETENEQENQMSDLEEMVDSLVSETDESVVDEEIEVESVQEFHESEVENASEMNDPINEKEKEREINFEGKTVKLYNLKGSKVMYSDTEFPLSAVNPDLIDKIFLVVSEETSEIPKETSRLPKESSRNPVESSDISKESFASHKKTFENSMKSSGSNTFVSGPVQTETISIGTNETNHQFRIRKRGIEESNMHPKIKRNPKDVYGDRTCYSCRKVGHMAKDCPLNIKINKSVKKPNKHHFTQTTTIMTNGIPVSKGAIKQENESVKQQPCDKKKNNFQKQKQTDDKPVSKIKITKILNRNEPIPEAFKKSFENKTTMKAVESGSPKKTTGLPK
jgi:hypothetical protein